MKLRPTQDRRRHRAAFTLLEMMVVVAIIVALAGVGIFYMAGQAEEGNKAKAVAGVRQLTDMVTTFKLQNGRWPNDFDELLGKTPDGHGPYARSPEDFLDPWGSRYVYDPAGQNNQGLQPDISSQGPQFIIANWTRKPIPRQ